MRLLRQTTMLQSSNSRRVILALATLVLALLVACGNDSKESQAPEWAVDAVPAPSHLLFRTPFFPDEIVPRDEFESLNIDPSIYGPEAMEPGQSFRYLISVFRCCVVVYPVDIQAEWSVDPEGVARIDEKTGFLAINESAAHGATVTLTAKVEGVEEPVTRELTVFSSAQNPLIGPWREDRASGGVRELLFQSDGRYFATWIMLESFVDLGGRYMVDTTTGKIEMIQGFEREKTEGFQGAGNFEIDDQGLLLTGICPEEPDPGNPDCVRRFVRAE